MFIKSKFANGINLEGWLMKKITILIPVYNELNTLDIIIKKVENASFGGLDKEIILIDDCSIDGTKELYAKYPYKVLYHKENQGKGAAVRTGIKEATGDIIVIQDADLEYNPDDYEPLIQALLDDKADVCYGSRFMKESSSSSYMILNYLGNKFISAFTSLIFGRSLTDMETCYKAFKAEYIKNMDLKSNRFDFEPEVTAKLLKNKVRLLEIPISYNGRNFSEGKKITWRDGIHAMIALIKYKYTD